MNEHDRAAYRAFVRDNHPDRGGDPDEFVAGLARFRALGSIGSSEPVSPAPSASGADGAGDARSAEPSWDDPRWDAPIEFVTPLSIPMRVAVALIRTLHWHQRQRRVQ